jgi:uracil-DNA glycosylase family 4
MADQMIAFPRAKARLWFFSCTPLDRNYTGHMSDAFHPLLEATIQHLEDLQAWGVKFLTLAPETLTALRSTSPPRSARPMMRRLPASSFTSTTSGSSPTAPRPPARSPREGAEFALSATPLSGAASMASDATRPEAMADLRQRVLTCQKCPPLVRARQNVVFGVGDIHSPLMFVGEAPGADEDAQGEPFVGKAGQLLTRIIQAMGFTRQTVFIANILKCRPDTPGQSAGNRKPTPAEMQTCLPYLLEQIHLIQPKVIVALGATAVDGLLGKTVGITRLRGHFQDFRGVPVMPTYHPAYLLRNQSLGVKREVWEDMLQVLDKLGCPISEKQRNFFLARSTSTPESA